MSHSLTLICRNDPCLTGVLSDGVNGFAYNTKQELVDDVIRVLTDDRLRKQMGKASLEKSREFSVECCVDRMLELYKKVIDTRNNPQLDYDLLKTELQQANTELQQA
jgi:1,2-diacylglycerol 3-alpha-glucosyltransferase